MKLGSRFACLFSVLAISGLIAPSIPGQQPAAGPKSRVGGSIFDSTITRPLEGATVQLASRSDLLKGPSFTTMTDASGFFRFDSVPSGEYVITFFHQRLDALGLVGPVRPVTVPLGGGRVEIELGIPGARRLYAMHCGLRPVNDSSGMILGSVESAADGSPAADVSVTAQWFELSMGSKGLVQSRPAVRAKTSAQGRFALCRMPWDTRVTVWATAGKATTGSVDVDIPAFGIKTADLLVDLADTVRGDTARTRHGTARVAGVVRGPNGQPLAGARVGLQGTFSETTADEHGAYQLAALPAGTQTIEARAIGYVPIRSTINLYPNRAVTKDLAFDAAAQVLETVDVQAKQIYSRSEQEFLAAKKGLGYFIDADQIEKRQPFRTSDLLRMAPGVSIYQGSGLGDQTQIQIRGASSLSGPCPPMLVVDGMRLEGAAGDIDQITRPEDIQGIAIYRGPSETPVEYQGFNSCGAIVVWTKRGGPRAPKRAPPARPRSSP
jgi:Carboxypeptidase regulatory-like domain/TonB-dependent Receptor Plug Domain